MNKIRTREYSLKTNYDFSVTYRITGDYTGKNLYADVTNGNDTKILSFSITKLLSEGKTYITLKLTKAQIAILGIGQFFSDLKLDEGEGNENPLVNIILNIEYGKTTST